MAGQGTPYLVARNIDWDVNDTDAEIDNPFLHFDNFVGRRLSIEADSGNGRQIHTMVYNFRTAADAMAALQRHPTIPVRGRHYPLTMYNIESPQLLDTVEDRHAQGRAEVTSPPRKRLKKEQPATDQKITCKICFTELEGPYATPCRRCKNPECYECLGKRFTFATGDMDRMPVTCCGSVMHHEVARGILPAAEFENYKLKYDERMNTVNPLYCPVPTCSAFIPPRMFNQNDNTVTCHLCSTIVCTQCKQHAEEDHTCPKDDARKLIVDTFHYKLCPRCGNGVMKMYGCPHVRCQCGAHWCWDCQRPMNACYAKPCRAARVEGNYSDGEEDQVDSDDENAPAAPAASAPTVHETTEANADAALAEPNSNVQTTHTDAEHEVADALHILRNRVITLASTQSPPATVEEGGATHESTEPTMAVPDHTNTGVTVETSSTLANPQAATLVEASRHYIGGSVTEEADSTTTVTATRAEPVSEIDATLGIASESATAVQAAADAVVADESSTEPATNHAENLDDPDEFDWEGRDLDLGNEPVDETWDSWGCRHHFYDFGKDQVPRFWLVGVNPGDDLALEIECMSCFKKANVWDDKDELEAFRTSYAGKDDIELRSVEMKEKWAEWKAKVKAAAAGDKDASTSASRPKRTVRKSQCAFECRHGCGIVYCGACKKESRRRMRRERRPTDVPSEEQ